MTENEAIEQLAERLRHALETSGRSGGIRTGWSIESMVSDLRDFANAIRKQCQAEMACTLLTQETERMGGYDSAIEECLDPGCALDANHVGPCKRNG